MKNNQQRPDPTIADFDYITSAIGNAYSSGITFDQLWSAVVLSETREQLDFVILSTIEYNKIIEKTKSKKRS